MRRSKVARPRSPAVLTLEGRRSRRSARSPRSRRRRPRRPHRDRSRACMETVRSWMRSSPGFSCSPPGGTGRVAGTSGSGTGAVAGGDRGAVLVLARLLGQLGDGGVAGRGARGRGATRSAFGLLERGSAGGVTAVVGAALVRELMPTTRQSAPPRGRRPRRGIASSAKRGRRARRSSQAEPRDSPSRGGKPSAAQASSSAAKSRSISGRIARSSRLEASLSSRSFIERPPQLLDGAVECGCRRCSRSCRSPLRSRRWRARRST